jgi:hypothetical protein
MLQSATFVILGEYWDYSADLLDRGKNPIKSVKNGMNFLEGAW